MNSTSNTFQTFVDNQDYLILYMNKSNQQKNSQHNSNNLLKSDDNSDQIPKVQNTTTYLIPITSTHVNTALQKVSSINEKTHCNEVLQISSNIDESEKDETLYESETNEYQPDNKSSHENIVDDDTLPFYNQ